LPRDLLAAPRSRWTSVEAATLGATACRAPNRRLGPSGVLRLCQVSRTETEALAASHLPQARTAAVAACRTAPHQVILAPPCPRRAIPRQWGSLVDTAPCCYEWRGSSVTLISRPHPPQGSLPAG